MLGTVINIIDFRYKKRQAEREKADEEKRIKKLKERELSRESLNAVIVAGDDESDE